MPLVKTIDLLRHATERRYGVAAINTYNYETMLWVAKAAEREGLPVIIQLYPGFGGYIPFDRFIAMAHDIARQSPVPVAVHLDHCDTVDTALAGIRDGFMSVMIDGSSKSFDENAAMTRQVVSVARVFGADVEAELGHVGRGSNVGDFTNEELYTKPGEAAEFVALTGCGWLAVAVGSAHGAYARTPSLDFGRIAAIRSAVDVPLVMHGTSDIPGDQLQKAVSLGVAKYNIATEYDRAYGAFTREVCAENPAFSGFRLLKAVGEKMVDYTAAKLRLLNPGGVTPQGE